MNVKNILSIVLVFSILLSSFVGITKAISVKNNDNNNPIVYKALLMGVAHYGYPNDLKGPLNDVETIESALIKGGFLQENIITLKDKYKYHAIQELGKLANENTGPDDNDVTIIHYSGHGARKTVTDPEREEDNTEEYLVFREDDPFFRDDQFIDMVINIKGIKIVILDSCYSSGFRDDVEMV